MMLRPVKVRLYTIPGSHPGVAAQLMLKYKGIEFKRTDLFPVISKLRPKPGFTDTKPNTGSSLNTGAPTS